MYTDYTRSVIEKVRLEDLLALLADRLKVGRLVLVQEIGVRVPVRQQIPQVSPYFFCDARSLICRTLGFGPRNRGSSPCPPALVKSARSGHFYVELADKKSTFVLCVGLEPPEAYRTECSEYGS